MSLFYEFTKKVSSLEVVLPRSQRQCSAQCTTEAADIAAIQLHVRRDAARQAPQPSDLPGVVGCSPETTRTTVLTFLEPAKITF